MLLCVACQSNVFLIECKQSNTNYPGGKNSCVVNDFALICAGEMQHKTHDFTLPRNWLDILKCAIYFGFFWITLALFLLTGTYNINMFSFGYLIAAFSFCYVGANFNMKPIRSILNWWKLLIIFNLLVILVKSILRAQLKSDAGIDLLTSIREIHRDIISTEVWRIIC